MPRARCAPSPRRGEGWGEGVQVTKGNPDFARRLRRNQTDAERLLWFRLRDRRLAGLKFKRQVPIDRYVVDFLCAEGKLIVEIDGGQHDQHRKRDDIRTAALEAMGYLVVRFWNNDVMQNTEGVLQDILNTVSRPRSEPPHPNPLPSRSRIYPISAKLKCRNSGKPEFGRERERTEAVAPSSAEMARH